MEAEAWERVEALFLAAAELDAGDRRAFLDRACGDDRGLRGEVESLLAADGDDDDGFLETPLLAAVAVAGEKPGREGSIGPYRLLRRIGEGGMGTVYLALRADDEYRQEVALKVFAWGRERRDLVRRFRTERQILASLRHPSIAQLLDGGTTRDGLPYIVMELIAGEPIDVYCDRRRLTVEARVELFQQLCSAVEYAHRNLVVHRDIKPSNVLVTAGGVPKLLDFGIAKLMAPEAFPQTVEHTATGQRLMTPHYASPEQVRGEPVTTASDVYSLGVLLFELLTGRPPYAVGSRRTADVERAVLEEEPRRPSTAVARTATGRPAAAGEAATPESVSRARGTRPERLRRQLAGDLDRIVMKALRKEPERRYGSVEQLNEDLERHRDGRPVSARPDTVGYRTVKFVRRHRFGVAAAAAFVLLMIGFAVAMSLERDQARHERDKAQAVAAFLKEIFQVSDPSQARGETITARELLDRGAERLERELAAQPEVEADLAGTIGDVYRSLGLYAPAEPLLERSLELRRSLHGDAHRSVVSAVVDLAALLADQGDLGGAEALLRRAGNQQGDRRDSEWARIADNLGVVLGKKGEFAESEELLRQAVALRRELLGAGHPDVAESLNNLGRVFEETGRLATAEERYREALEIARRSHGDVHPRVVAMLNNLGMALQRQGKLAAAEARYLESLEAGRKLFGDEHPRVALFLNNLAVLYGVRGEYDRAGPIFLQVLEMRRRLLGDVHPAVAESLNNLGRLKQVTGEPAAAEELYRQALEISRQALGEEHPTIAIHLSNLALLRDEAGDLSAAEALYRESLGMQRRLLDEDHPQLGSTLSALGSVLARGGEAAAAEAMLRQGLDVLRRALPEAHPWTVTAESRLGECLAALGRFEEAEPLVVTAYETLAGSQGPEHRASVAALRRVVGLYAAWGRTPEADRYRALLPG